MPHAAKNPLDEIFQRLGNPPVPPAEVEAKPDPERPERTIYSIVGLSSDAVQAAITSIMSEVEESGGLANFIGPIRLKGGYGAAGEVIVDRVPA